MLTEQNIIILLVGPKGVGKTTIGALAEGELGIAFLRVEPIYLSIIEANPHLSGAELEPVGFGALLGAVHELARTRRVICLESTGTAGYFPEFLRQLQVRYRVCLVRVSAPADVCSARVLARDRTDHIPVSDERVEEINRIAAAVSLPWDLEIDNSATGNEGAVVSALAELLAANQGA
jgi:hypothetical protein